MQLKALSGLEELQQNCPAIKQRSFQSARLFQCGSGRRRISQDLLHKSADEPCTGAARRPKDEPMACIGCATLGERTPPKWTPEQVEKGYKRVFLRKGLEMSRIPNWPLQPLLGLLAKLNMYQNHNISQRKHMFRTEKPCFRKVRHELIDGSMSWTPVSAWELGALKLMPQRESNLP